MLEKKLSPEWSEVYRKDDNVHCRNCHQTLSDKIERIKSHLNICLKRTVKPIIQNVSDPVPSCSFHVNDPVPSCSSQKTNNRDPPPPKI